MINEDVKAYQNGYKQLDPAYATLSDIEPNEEKKSRLTITKAQHYFWATDDKILIRK